ncbi:hypothetical protein [Arcobacter sp. L]|uniref:hypothetical protein n=1 Tax=Arcobacter sp. L TaxID=944547 RepID=UPI0002296733|nr:hypothetical protein [Arcobacter sp. L]BAK74721.1 hypothetical protein ABLL_P1_0001 [Arcobacter sp. L]
MQDEEIFRMLTADLSADEKEIAKLVWSTNDLSELVFVMQNALSQGKVKDEEKAKLWSELVQKMIFHSTTKDK